MIIRTRNGVSNIPVISGVLLLGLILFATIEIWWLQESISKEIFVVMAAIVVILITQFLFCMRWCTLKNGVIHCKTLFQKIEIPHAAARITLEKNWWCVVAYYLFLLTDGWYGLLEPRWIVLSGPSQRFTVGFTSHVRNRAQYLKDITGAFSIKAEGIDLSAIQKKANTYRKIDYWTYFIILIFAFIAAIFLFSQQ